MLQPGDKVPDFTATDQHGNPVRFSDLLAAGPTVIFFYPKAMTTGCTKESCHFRDLDGEFRAAGAQRVGISADSVAKQAQFDQKHGLGYTLLSDSGKLVFEQMRHPVLEDTCAKGQLVPNDLVLAAPLGAGRGNNAGCERPQILLLTGPNMAGKSTYIRAGALCVILAQMGGASRLPCAT